MNENSMQQSGGTGLTMGQKHVVLAVGSFALGSVFMWWWQQRKAR